MNTHENTTAAPVRRRAWPVLLLALPAFVAIWSGWVELGRLTGFGPVSPLPGIWDDARIDTAITLPIGVETYAAYAMSVWLSPAVSERARAFARVSAIGSLILGAAGQVAYHLMAAAGMVRAPWWITALVACLPVAVLGMGAGLAHLVRDTDDQDQADQDQGDHGDQDDAEARTERAVILNALRDQHPTWPDQAIAGTAAVLASGEALSTPAPRLLDTDQDVTTDRGAEADQGSEVATVQTATEIRPASVRKPRPDRRSNADKARALRDRHPDWPLSRIAERVGVTERTARRYFAPASAAEVEAPTTVPDPTEASDLAA